MECLCLEFGMLTVPWKPGFTGGGAEANTISCISILFVETSSLQGMFCDDN